MRKILIALPVLFSFACNEQQILTNTYIHDQHTFAKPNEAVVKHLSLNIHVDFDKKIIEGVASYEIEISGTADTIYLDTKDLQITKVLNADGTRDLQFELVPGSGFMGAALRIALNGERKKIHIFYSTSPQAEALQWLSPHQTADKKYPFLFTQSQAILARTWIPCQDGPGIRFTYDARVKVPKELLAVMSASNPVSKNDSGIYHFRQEKAIPSYLMALSVGDIVYKELGDRTGVYGEHSMIEKAAYEFAGMQKMLEAAEKLYGPYQWGRYDVLVLPPSFPFGGMENPELTFATPTIIAGDRSLVSLIAHELAHSWSGNLVTNANWNNFWLNEGFTVYFERRIMEEIEGKEYTDMLHVLGFQDLQTELDLIGREDPDTRLHLDLGGRNPDDGLTSIAYEKGAYLLILMEQAAGREKFDAFLRKYFSDHAFQTMDDKRFLEYYKKEFIKGDKALADKIRIEEWIYKPGLPENCPQFISTRLENVNNILANFHSEGVVDVERTKNWSSHEWLHFVRFLPVGLNVDQMKYLDATFGFTQTGNNEVLAAWLHYVIVHQYKKGYPVLEQFLTNVGRRKFLTPLYSELIRTEAGKKMALDIYAKARPNYHSVSTQTIDQLLGIKTD